MVVIKMNKNWRFKGIFLAFLSAILYSLNVPIIKHYLNFIDEHSILFITYLGSFLGMLLIILFKKKKIIPAKKDAVNILGVVVCEICASFTIAKSLTILNASTVSLFIVFEVAFTAIFSIYVFKQGKLSRKLLLAIIFVTLGGIFLSLNGLFNIKSYSAVLLVLLTTILWGLENTLTAKTSQNNALILVFYKCLGVALINYLLIFKTTQVFDLIKDYYFLMIIGFFTYGVSILCFALGTKYLDASKTAIIFAFSPFISTLISIVLFKESVTVWFILSFILMIIGIYFSIADSRKN